jgi:DNA-binding CsgD family transcriptional regulator
VKTSVRFQLILLWILLFCVQCAFANHADELNKQGWAQLAIDNDVEAVRLFSQALDEARSTNDTLNQGNSLLNLGIATYSVSITDGMNYALRAIEEFKKFEKSNPQRSLEGRSKCLQLIGTINARQGKFRESIELSKEALLGFSKEDSSDYPGLIFSSLGLGYSKLGKIDSSDYYYEKALEARIRSGNVIYLPGAYYNAAIVQMRKGNAQESKNYFDKALAISESSGNRQSTVHVLLGISKWELQFDKDQKKAEEIILQAKEIALSLTDRSYFLNCLDHLIAIRKLQNDYKSVSALLEERETINDTLFTYEKQRLQNSLEIQFEVSEKDRQVKLAEQEKNIAVLTNYLLWLVIAFVLITALTIIYFIRRNHKRDKQLLSTKEQLMIAIEEKKKLKEQQLQNEIEFKESQLTAMAVQMVQKNELLQQLKEKLEEDKSISKESPINKIIHKDQNQDKEWSDFNAHFESLNKNFYSRLKSAYPEISPNDLKICALIKLNLSIKEMAAILNISPDSVKTARYRLRKKLQLNTEDNLTDFILNLQ